MGTVQGLDKDRMLAIEAASVVGGTINGSGHLILTKHDGSTIDAGSALPALPTASTTTQGIVELATSAETSTGTDTVRAVTPAGLSSALTAFVPDASDTAKGKVELATSAETITGTDTARAVTPAGLAAVVSSDTARGLVELATSAETITGTDTARAVTPAGLAAKVASTTAQGIVELATSAETITGTDTVRAVTPAGLAAVISSDTARGLVELATTTEAIAGTDTSRAVTPAGLFAANPIEVLSGGSLAANTWYQIGTFGTGASSGFNSKASAEFIVSVHNSGGQHEFLRIRCSVDFNTAYYTLNVEECSGYVLPSTFCQVRLVAINGAFGGHRLELLTPSGLSPSSGYTTRLVVKHDDWLSSDARWTPVAVSSISSTISSPATLLATRGIGRTGDFIAPTLTNSWVNFGSPFSDAGYRMEFGSVVRLRGLIKSGTVLFAGTSPAFTLPVGYRPKSQMVYSVVANNAYGRVDVYADGKVSVLAGANNYVALDNITFIAEG